MSTELRQALIHVHDRCMGVDVAAATHEDSDTLQQTLVPESISLLEDGEALIVQTMVLFDRLAGGSRSPVDFVKEVDELVRHGVTARQVVDLSFLAHAEIIGWHRRLLAVRGGTDSSAWDLVELCDGCLQRVIKACAALENAVATYDGVSSGLDLLTELTAALDVRDAYGRLRREVMGVEPPNPDTLRERLLDSAAAVAWLVDTAGYAQVRIADRVALRKIQARLDEWLQVEEAGTADGAAGFALWEELVGFTQLLAGVNRREEVVEHDRQVVGEVWRAIFERTEVPPLVPPQLAPELRRLFGRDEELDVLLTAEGDLATVDLQPILSRICRELGLPEGG